MPPKTVLQRAIAQLRRGEPHLTLSDRRKLASLLMNLRIFEALDGPPGVPGDAPAPAALTDDGEMNGAP